LTVLALVLWFGYKFQMAGNQLAATALMAAVLCETILVTYFAQRTKSVHTDDTLRANPASKLPSSIGSVTSFYSPLAGSMLLVWGGRFILIAIIARAADSEMALAAWPAAWGIVLVIANSTRMVQQIVIKHRREFSDQMLLGFSVLIGFTLSVLLLLIGISSIGNFLLNLFVGSNNTLVSAIKPVLVIGAFVPLLVATQNAIQGFLISDGKTHSVGLSTWLGTSVLLSVAGLGVWADWPGASAAVIAMSVSIFCENLSLLWQYKKS
jgi:hypothetical protein